MGAKAGAECVVPKPKIPWHKGCLAFIGQQYGPFSDTLSIQREQRHALIGHPTWNFAPPPGYNAGNPLLVHIEPHVAGRGKNRTTSVTTAMFQKLKKFASGFKAQYFSKEAKIVSGELVGRPLKTTTGAIRKKTDQDDAWFFFLAGQSKRIFDIGANIGYTALLANVQGKVEKLLLVDPNPEALSLAAKNLILNNLAGNCRFFVSFVSRESGEKIPFYTLGHGAAGSMFKGHAESAAAVGHHFMVSTITVDDLVNLFGWQPDLVKIDVEGAEALVLEGARQLAKNQATTFMVEMHSPPELPMAENARQILTWCHSNNYEAWYMKEAKKLESPESIAHRGKCHLLLMPKDWHYPEPLKAIEQGAALPKNI